MTEIDIDISFGPVVSMPVAVSQANTLLTTGPAKLCGWSLLEYSGAAVAACTFVSGDSVVGQSAMVAGQSDSHTLPEGGIYCPQGISLGAASGDFAGCAYVRLCQ